MRVRARVQTYTCTWHAHTHIRSTRYVYIDRREIDQGLSHRGLFIGDFAVKNFLTLRMLAFKELSNCADRSRRR